MFDDIDETAIAAAEALEERQRGGVIAGIRAALDAPGREDCAGCGDEIDAARRAAMPSAVRCVRCQAKYERRGK